MRCTRVDPGRFRTALDEGVDAIQAAGADVILMNMQYSPRTESMIAVGPYADNMRAVAQQRRVPLFDRFGIMRYWTDYKIFDLNAPRCRPGAAGSRLHRQRDGHVHPGSGRLHTLNGRRGNK